MPAETAFQAAWTLPCDIAAIRDGVVAVQDGLVCYVGSKANYRGAIHQLGNVAIIPGLVNAHTHLEFSDLQKPLGRPNMAFTSWIEEIVRYRMQMNDDPKASLEHKTNAIKRGIRESIAAGVVGIGEIASYPFQSDVYQQILDQLAPAECSITVFLEQLGRDANQLESRLNQLTEELQQANAGRNISMGLSPHAPYSTHPKLVDAMATLARQESLPVAMHLAETKEELQLLKTVDGPFVSTLKKLQAWYPESYRTGDSVSRVMGQIPGSHPLLMIHGNYLDDTDIDAVAVRSQATSVVYCPRTSEYFGHTHHPFRKLLQRGVNVAIGTDSRASNADLDLFAELKWIRGKHPDFEPATILRMGTINGARALGQESNLGSITPGKRALLNIVQFAEGETADPYAAILAESARCIPLRNWLKQS